MASPQKQTSRHPSGETPMVGRLFRLDLSDNCMVGVIGASWAAQYLACGFDVVATDPAPNAEANLRKYVDAAWGPRRSHASRRLRPA